MRRLLKIAARMAWLLPVHQAVAQTPEPSPSYQVRSRETLGAYHHTAFFKQQGGVGGASLAQTSDGFLWLATSRKGPSRFDGSGFSTFEPAPGQALPDAQLQRAIGAEGGGLWISSYLGATLLRNGHLTTYGPAANYVGTNGWFSKGPDGHVWSNTDQAVMTFEAGAWRVVYRAPQANPMQHSIDPDGNVWLQLMGKLTVIPSGRNAPQSPGVDVDLWSVEAGKNHLLYAMGPNHVRFFRRSGVLLEEVARPLDVQAFRGWEAKDGSLWISTTGDGIWFIPHDELLAAIGERRAPHAEHFGQAEGLTSSYAPTLLEDDRGDIWVGTNFGMDRFRPTALTRIRLPAGINGVSSAIDGEGHLWVGSENQPVLFVPPHGDPQPLAIPQGHLTTYSDARDGTAWVAGEQALWQLRSAGPVRIESFDFARASGGAIAPCLLRDDDGRFYVCQDIAHGGNLMVADGGLVEPVFDHVVAPLALAKSRNGDVWAAGREKDHLYRIRNGKVQAVLTSAQGLDVGVVRAITPAGNGVWVGGDQGIDWFDGKRFRALRFTDSESAPPATGVVIDAGGDLWFQCLDGLGRISAAQLARWRTNATTTVDPELFGEEDGVIGPPLLGLTQPSLRLDATGRIWVQSRDGLAWIDPSMVARRDHATTVVLDGMDVAGRHIPPGAFPDTLEPDQRDLRIRYTSPTIDRTDRVTFRYRLVGASDAWQDAGTRREAVFNNIAPGRHRFEVVAVDRDGRTSSPPATFSFERRPAYFETWWFKGLWLLPFACILWVIHLMRARTLMRHLRIRSDERDAVARQIHDTLLQRMQSLNMALGRLAADLRIPEEPRRSILRAADESRKTITEGRDQIVSLRSDDDIGLALYDHIQREGKLLEEDNGIGFSVEATGIPRVLRAEAASELRHVALEAIRNAFSHSGSSSVHVTLTYESRTFWLVIADDGKGISLKAVDDARKGGHFGVASMKERVAGLRGRMVIESAPGEGTEIHVSVPARIAYAKRRMLPWNFA